MLNYFRTLIPLSSNAFVFVIIIVTKLHQPPRYICNGWQGVKHQVTYLHYIRWLKPVRMTKKIYFLFLFKNKNNTKTMELFNAKFERSCWKESRKKSQHQVFSMNSLEGWQLKQHSYKLSQNNNNKNMFTQTMIINIIQSHKGYTGNKK